MRGPLGDTPSIRNAIFLQSREDTANLRTKILDFRGSDSSRILMNCKGRNYHVQGYWQHLIVDSVFRETLHAEHIIIPPEIPSVSKLGPLTRLYLGGGVSSSC